MPGKSAFDERHDLSLGAGSQTTTLAAKEFLQSSDTILALGTSLTATPYAQDIPPGKRIIQNVDNPDDINKDQSVEIPLIGDTKETINLLIEDLRELYGTSRMDDSNIRNEIAKYTNNAKLTKIKIVETNHFRRFQAKRTSDSKSAHFFT